MALVTLGFPPLLIMVLGLLFKHAGDRRIQKAADEEFDTYLEYEYSYAFVIAWYGGMIMLSIFGPLFWIDIWEAPNNIESAMYIFVMWILLIIVKWLWFSMLYIRRTAHLGLVRTLVVLDVLIAVTYSVLVLVTMHLADRPWYHWLVILTVFHPAFEWVAMLNANKYRQHENQHDYSKPTANNIVSLNTGESYYSTLADVLPSTSAPHPNNN